MKNKILSIAAIVLIFFISVLVFNYLKSRSHLSDINNNPQPVLNLTGEEISRLGNGVIVRFPATLVRRQSESNCIELFAQDDFKKYNGDGKFTISSRFDSKFYLANLFERKTNTATITGKMTFVRDSTDTSKTCGIITGQLFEITEVEYF